MKLLFQKEVLHTMQKGQVHQLTLYWALPPQGQGLSHSTQLLEVLPYYNRFHIS